MHLRTLPALICAFAASLAMARPLPAQEPPPPAAPPGATVTASKGSVTITKGGEDSSGSSNLNSILAPGTIITTGEDGTLDLVLGPGCSIQVQPNTRIRIGDTVMNRAVNEMGDPIPEVTITLETGTLVTTTAGGAGAVPTEILSMIRLPFGRTWQTATPDQIADAVLEAVKRNPESAPEIVRAAIQSVRMTGRFPSSGPGDGKQVIEDNGDEERSLEEMAAMIGNAAKEGNPGMATEIDQAVMGALRSSGLSGMSLVIITPRGNVSPVVGGVTIVSSTNVDPAVSTVVVASVSGIDMVTTTEGQQVPVGEGMVVILRPDGIEYSTIKDYPNLPGLGGTVPPVPLPLVPPPDLPSATPTPTPSPTPTPTPTPTPAPVSP